MSKFRKKPVTIEAITFDELVAHGLANGANVVNGMPWSFQYNGHPITHENDDCYLIPTLEGTMKMLRGDRLITGVKGEIYPCKPDIFAATYEAVSDEPATWKAGTQMEERRKAERRKNWEWKTGKVSTAAYVAESGDKMLHAERRKSDRRQMEERKPFCEVTVSHGAPPAPSPAPWESANREPQASQFDLEEIGRIMHESWAKTKRAQGFHGPRDGCVPCDESRERSIMGGFRCPKFHADLIPWEELPEKQKDINRHAFDAVLPYFKTKSGRELQELRGLVGRMLMRQHWAHRFGGVISCRICDSSVGSPLTAKDVYHKPTCLISEAEAAIKETHNG